MNLLAKRMTVTPEPDSYRTVAREAFSIKLVFHGDSLELRKERGLQSSAVTRRVGEERLRGTLSGFCSENVIPGATCFPCPWMVPVSWGSASSIRYSREWFQACPLSQPALRVTQSRVPKLWVSFLL